MGFLGLLPGVFSLVAVILVVVTVVLSVKGSAKLKNNLECTGTIVRFYENTSQMFRGDYEHKGISPVISYTVNGQTYEFIGHYYDTTMKVGKQVKVLYDRNDCTKATIKTGVYLAPIITGSLTVLFGILAVAFYVAKFLFLI